MSENESTTSQQPTRLRPTDPPEVVLAAGTQTSGELKAEGDVRVDGVFEGRIEVVGWVVVGEQAKVTADVAARHVQVDGWVRGAIQAVGQVQVGPTGQVWGDIAAAEVFVDPGGQVHPPEEEPPLQPTLPAMPAPEPKAPPVEIIAPTRHPARERLRQAETRARQQTLRRWALSLGIIAVGILIVCGVLVLSELLPGAAPASEATPTRLAAGPTMTSVSEATPTSTATPRPTLAPTHTPISEATATATPTNTPTPLPTSSPTSVPTNTPTSAPTQPPTASPVSETTPTATAADTATPAATQTPTATTAPASPTPTATEVVTPTASPTSTVPGGYPFVPDGPVVSEYPNCAPAVVWLRGEVRNATPEQLQYVSVQARHLDGRVLTEPVQPNGNYEVRLYTQGPCPVTLVDSRDGTRLSPTVYVEYADTCNGSAFTLHWKRAEPG